MSLACDWWDFWLFNIVVSWVTSTILIRTCLVTNTYLFIFLIQVSLRKQIISNELKELTQTAPLLVVLHYNDLSTAEWITARQTLAQDDLRIRVVPSKVAAKSLSNSKYENIVPLFSGCTAIAYSKSDKLQQLLSHVKSQDKLVVLGGIFHSQVLTPQALRACAALPSMEVLRAVMLGTLSQAQSSLCSFAGNPLQQLSLNLTQVASKIQ